MNSLRGMLIVCGLALAGFSGGAFRFPDSSGEVSVASTSLDGGRRPLVLPDTPQGWGGLGICYGPLRDGQFPGGPSPTEAQIREDLHIIAKHWSAIRMYAALGSAEIACKIIHEEKLPLKVLLGAWIAQEAKVGPDGKPTELNPENAKLNQAEVALAIKLANQYPDVVAALGIGNEALVSWSAYRVPTSVVIGYLKQARAATKVPVTTCDTDLFWSTPESVEVAKECDFLALHAYAMWNKQSLKNSLPWTRGQIAATRKMHPDLPIVMTELGWATQKGTQGDQAKLITAEPNEEDQELFYRAFRDWALEAKLTYFYFSAFDENWKGGNEPSEVEKHWGVFKADRSPKIVMEGDKKPAK